MLLVPDSVLLLQIQLAALETFVLLALNIVNKALRTMLQVLFLDTSFLQKCMLPDG